MVYLVQIINTARDAWWLMLGILHLIYVPVSQNQQAWTVNHYARLNLGATGDRNDAWLLL